MEIIFSLEEIDQVAQHVLDYATNRIVLFDAPMGTGKTTLIKALAKQLEIDDLTSSPTFSLVNEYLSPISKQRVFHFDFYRINDEEELYDMGIEEYFDSSAWCFIEWPEKAPNLLEQEQKTIVKIEVLADGKRKLYVINE